MPWDELTTINFPVVLLNNFKIFASRIMLKSLNVCPGLNNIFVVCVIYVFLSFFAVTDAQSIYSIEEALHCDNDTELSYYFALQAAKITPQKIRLTANYDAEVLLTWTATGDDGLNGIASGYEIHYLEAKYGPISNELAWRYSNRVSGEPIPSPSGQTDSMIITGLEDGKGYYFCIKAYDDAGNYSGLSNSTLKYAGNLGSTIDVVSYGLGRAIIEPDKEFYTPNEMVYLYAIPEADWEFVGWSGDVQSYSNPIAFHVNDDYRIIANFTTDFIPGDVNADGALTGQDIVYLVQYFRGEQMPPMPYLAGDTNGNCLVTGQDVTYFINYIRGIGNSPVCGNCGAVLISLDDYPHSPSAK